MKDALLQLVVGFADPREGEEPFGEYVSLVVQGATISGKVISREEFMRTHPLLAAVQSGIDQVPDEGPAFTEVPDESAEAQRPPNYVHLAEARIWGPGVPPLPDGGDALVVRVRIEDVSAWWLGHLRRGTAPVRE